jgi:tetratricopeptide (TPR) repeat protein
MQHKDSEAVSYYQRLYDNNKSDAQVIDAYLGALLKTRDFNKVVELSSPLINENADFIAANPEFVSFYLKRAAAYQGLQKPDLALKDIDEGFAVGVLAATKSGNYLPFVSVLNQASSSILSPELVAERLRVRVAAAPAENISKIGLIQTLLIMNTPEEALKIVDTMTPPANDPVMQLLILRESALVHGQTKQYAAAEKNYLELEKIQPNNVENLNNYAFLLADGMNRPKDAIKYAETAIKLLSTRSDPGQLSSNAANVYDTLGWAYYLANDNEKAISNLQKSIKVQPQAAAYFHLATAYFKANDLIVAQQECLEGLKLATAKHDTETLKGLNDLKLKLKLP